MTTPTTSTRTAGTAETLRARAVNVLSPVPRDFPIAPIVDPTCPSDFDLNPDALADWSRPFEVPKPAAVLVGIVMRAELTVLLTERPLHLRAHAGQIAFPGGKPEPGERTPAATALREAYEETGLDSRLAEPLGVLPAYRTGTGYLIVPVVALVRPPPVWHADPHEVSSVFEVPLAFLMDPANHQIETRVLAGRSRSFYAMPYGERFIWGATAGILRSMQELLFPK